jgi:hypothetical protein
MGKCFFVAHIRIPYGETSRSGFFEDAAVAIQEGKEQVEAILKNNRMFSPINELYLEVSAVEFHSWITGDLSNQDGEFVYLGMACLKTPPSNIQAQTVDDGKTIDYSDEFTGREHEIEIVWEQEFQKQE